MIKARRLLTDLRRVVPNPYLEEDMPVRSHEGSCGPESGCDTLCAELASMAEYNGVLARVDKFLKGEDE